MDERFRVKQKLSAAENVHGLPRLLTPAYDYVVTLLESLLDAIVRLDGDALVMHVGEKPYVVTTSSAMNAYRGPLAWGQVELSSRVLTPDAVLSMVGQILPDEQRRALDEVGAIEHEIPAPAGSTDRFSVVAARGGDDIWLELRRHPAAEGVAVGQVTPAAAEHAPAPEPAPASEKDADRAVSTAVGLQEPPEESAAIAPPALQVPEEPPVEHPELAVQPELQEAEAAISDLESAIEEPALETPLELVEAEAQHTPTDEDVDAMLAATAASLLAAGRSAGEPAPGESRETIFVAESFEIVVEGEEDEQEDADAVEELDLTAELHGVPASWPSAAREEQRAEQTSEEVSALPDEAPASEPVSPAPPEPLAEEKVPAAHEEPAAEEAPVVPAAVAPEEEVLVGAQEAVAEVPSEEPEVEPGVLEEPVHAAAEPVQRGPEIPPPHEPAESPESVVAAQPVEPPRTKEPEIEESHVDIPAILPGRGATAPEPAVKPVSTPAPAFAPPQVTQERPAAAALAGNERLLQMLTAAAERGASTIYLVAQSKPMLRVEGEIAPLEQEPVLTPQDIERFAAALAPATQVREGAEWTSEVAGLGRVRGVSFRDHRGPGLILRLTTAKSISADQLNLSPEIRELCTLADGLVLVAGTRGSGRSTVLHSFVDLINRTRSEHVVTIESEIGYVHAIGRSFVSQREARDGAAAAAAVTAANREDADVIVVEDVQSPEVAAAMLNAAASGRLVFASIVAPSSAAALENLVNLFPEADRASARGTLAGALRGVVTQVLVKKASGGRIAARELLLNSPAVAAAVRSGDMAGVAAALEAGSRHGMTPLTEALSALVRGGAVHAAEAWRRAPDRQAILKVLARDGVDTSFAERLA